MKIYLLKEYWHYEGSSVIKAYVSKGSADKALELCKEYKRNIHGMLK